MIRTFPDVTWSDAELVSACLEGNEAAWSALVEKYKRLVYAIPLKYRLPPEDAADVFQGVWMDLYRDLPKLENKAGVKSWLITAGARRSLLHKKRREVAQRASELNPHLPDGSPDILALQTSLERGQQVRESVERLSERCQRMVRMLFFEDPPRPYREVAAELGLAEGSIGFIRGRCLNQLKKLLDPAGE